MAWLFACTWPIVVVLHNTNFLLESSFVILVYVYTYIMETSFNPSFSLGNYICDLLQIYKTVSAPHEWWGCRAASTYLLVNMAWMSLCHWSVHVKNLHVTSGQLYNGFFYTDLLSVPWKWWMLQNLIDIQHTPRKCDGWGCLLLASHHTGPGSVLGHYMWDMLWTKWHWDRFLSDYLSFPPIIIIPPMPHAHSLMYHWYKKATFKFTASSLLF